jgi:hypothetical protein
MFNWIPQLLQMCVQNPTLFLLAMHSCRAIERLSPESKAKLANIVRWGVKRAAGCAIESVLGDVGSNVINQVINDQDVADGAKELVKRGLAIGVEKALKESRVVS